MNHFKRQAGFAQLLVVALVAVIIAVVGLAIWQSQEAKSKADQATNTPAASTPVEEPSHTPAPSVANEVTVTELGFKMTLPDGLTSVKYVAKANQTGTANVSQYEYSVTSFSTASLEQTTAGTAACMAAQGPIGRITRYSVDPSTMGTTLSVKKKVGNFYLGFAFPQSPCSSDSEAARSQTSQISLFRQAFDTATAVSEK